MQKKNEICIKIYSENKECIYWFLSKKCSWLSEEEIFNVMLNICIILSGNEKVVYNLRSEFLQRKWLIKLAYNQAAKYSEKEE